MVSANRTDFELAFVDNLPPSRVFVQFHAPDLNNLALLWRMQEIIEMVTLHKRQTRLVSGLIDNIKMVSFGL
jgi:hypothetical protein